jgi:hypothetical protein
VRTDKKAIDNLRVQRQVENKNAVPLSACLNDRPIDETARKSVSQSVSNLTLFSMSVISQYQSM